MSFICCIINLFRIIYAQELWNFNCNIKSNSSFFSSLQFSVTNVCSFSLQFYKKKFMLSLNVKVKLKKKINQCQFV